MTKKEHDFGPWLEDVPGIDGKERRCRRCPAKEWLDPNGLTYGNDSARNDCLGLTARP